MTFWSKKKYPYKVTVHLNGRHPYLKGGELDVETRDVEVVVPATDWNDAERQAFLGIQGLSFWRASVKSIRRGW